MDESRYEELYREALDLATVAHRGQRDLGGFDYIGHPIAVASMVKGYKAKTVALLHDTIEDTFVSEEYLRDHGFPEDIVEAVVLLTKKPGLSEEEYYKRIKENPVAREVKMADNLHNLDPSRVIPGEKLAETMRKKYYEHFLYLYKE